MAEFIGLVSSSIKVFMRELDSLRLLIINAMIPTTVFTLYIALINVFRSYTLSLTPITNSVVDALIINVIDLVGGVAFVVAFSSLIVSILSSVFIISGVIRGWRDELRGVYYLFGSRGNVLVHVTIVLLLVVAYSYVLGISASITTALVLLKLLSSLGLVPLMNYGINVLYVISSSYFIPTILAITYVLIGVLRVRGYEIIP